MPLAWKGSVSRRWKTRSVFSLKRDRVPAGQVQQALRAQLLQQGRNGVDVHRVGLVACQAEQHGLVAAVALAGGAERAVQACRTRAVAASWPSCCRRSANSRAARIGPTVCELDGPMPILNRSKTETAMGGPRSGGQLGHRHAGAEQVAVALDVVDAAHRRPVLRAAAARPPGRRPPRASRRAASRPSAALARCAARSSAGCRRAARRPDSTLRDLGADGDHGVAEAVELVPATRSRSARPSACRPPGSSASARGSRSRSAAWPRPRR